MKMRSQANDPSNVGVGGSKASHKSVVDGGRPTEQKLRSSQVVSSSSKLLVSLIFLRFSRVFYVCSSNACLSCFML